MNEEWRYISGYDCYMISSKGRIKSLSRRIRSKGGLYRVTKEKIMKGYTSIYGYRTVMLYDGTGSDNAICGKIHRLVAFAFIPNPFNFPIINHIDSNPSNNCIENLEWCNHARNALHAYDNGLMPQRKKVTQISLNGETIKVWNCARDATNEGFLPPGISECCNGKKALYKGYKWEFTAASK